MIAVTGATGFIGKYLINFLPQPTKCLTRSYTFPTEKGTWLTGDLKNKNDINKIVKDTSILIHLACTSTPRNSEYDRIKDVMDNLIPTIQLLEAFSLENPKGHIIFCSSGGNIYDGKEGRPRVEHEIPLPRSTYSINKLSIEHHIRLLCESIGLAGTILRVSNPYGELASPQRSQGLIGVAFAKILANESLDIYEPLETIRDYIHINDVVEAFLLSIKHPPKSGECKIFNVGSGIGTSTQEILDLIEKTTKKKLKRNYLLSSNTQSVQNVLSYQKIKDTLNWTPTISLQEGIKNMWESIKHE